MIISQLFEQRTGDIQHSTEYHKLYHLTDNEGLALSVENNTINALRQNYISTTYRAETTHILGRSQYHYKLILDGDKLAETYGVFPYDHHVIEIGHYTRQRVSADEAEIGINTRKITPLDDFLLGVVIMSKPYSENQVLFLADIHRTTNSLEVDQIKNIHAIEALNRLTVPLYWQKGHDIIPLTNKDKNYLKDIERLMLVLDKNKSRSVKHLDIIDKLLGKYELKTSDDQPIDKDITNRRRQIPRIMATLNSYFRERNSRDIDPNHLKTMMADFLKVLGYGGNLSRQILVTADESNFFHPIVAAVSWTGFLRDLVQGNIDAALDDIRSAKPSSFAIERSSESDYNFIHAGTRMMGDEG